MPNLSWPEIKDRAIAFSREWAGETREAAESQTFWNDFFTVFGLKRRILASFQEPVRNLHGRFNRIDLLWRGTMLVEHKSVGESLEAAALQAFDYIQDLAREGRSDDIPRYIIVSNFARIALYDLEPDEQRPLPLFAGLRYDKCEFPLAEFQRHVRLFAFVIGERTVRVKPEDPANQRAYDRMCQLHDELQSGGLTGHDLERFLVRVLFCLFAEDTGIFEPNAFQGFVKNHTRQNGSDLGARLNELFQVLDTPIAKRPGTLPEDIASFPYVNGTLFTERLTIPSFTQRQRDALLQATEFQWARISPAVFGSLFQGVMDDDERRQQGAHYTSERDIMKVIRALFLDDLRAEFERMKNDRSTRRRTNLEAFNRRLSLLRFFDPACGCGNFLVLAYREIRLLELEVLRELTEREAQGGAPLVLVDVHQFYGIEIAEWPVRIAEVALWLMDHQMNQLVTESLGHSYIRLPLKESPHIFVDNALSSDWNAVLPKEQCTYLLGNPPFVGAKYQSAKQREDLQNVAGNDAKSGLLDYVTGWYFKAARYIQETKTVVGFVSTNSITQGEQVGILWKPLYLKYHIKIHFAHRTFKWKSESRGGAHVHVVIIGFAAFDRQGKQLFDYEEDGENATVNTVYNISPYLVEGKDFAITNRAKPICNVPEIGIGNKPIDGGYFLFTPAEKEEFIRVEPMAARYFRRWLGSEEFINGIERWFLWLGDTPPGELRRMPEVLKRIELVAKYRRGEIPAKGKTEVTERNEQTQELALTPTRLHVKNIPTTEYLLIPETTSEKRRYIPYGFITPDVMASNLVKVMSEATLFHFGILSSSMHMAWLRQVGGRLKSDPRYSIKLVYNNFPWPPEVDAHQKENLEKAAKAVLDARAEFLAPKGTSTLADLYNALTMPEPLVKAHAKLDRAVERCYRAEQFQTDRARVEFLFDLYERLTAPLVNAPHRRRRPPRQNSAQT